MKVTRKQRDVAELDITPMIDCVFQLIMFFMVIIALVVVIGIAIKFPESQGKDKDKSKSKEKVLAAHVGKDRINSEHQIQKHGIIKICGKDFFIDAYPDSVEQAAEYDKKFKDMENEIKRLINDEEYKKDMIAITGDITAYHWKIVRIIDIAKKNDVKGFSLTPPM